MTDWSYDRIAPEWDAALPPQSTVLDLGCGTGRPLAEYILARDHHVVGVDRSGWLLARARARFPGAEWIEARIEDFPFDHPPA